MSEPAFTDDDAREGWNRGADAWEAFVESGADYYRTDVHGPALLAACGPLRGARVLDLGCGQGYFSRELARAGATVSAVDLSDRLVELARRHEEREPLGIDYRRMSAADVAREWAPSTFDLVAACMSLQDMADVDAALRGAFSVLRPGGRMVLSVPHPCTDTAYREWERDAEGRKLALKLDRYFEAGPAVCDWNMPRLLHPWRTPCWRLTLAGWSGKVADAGFLVRRLHEPRPTDEQAARRPELDDCRRLPYFLVFDLVRPQPRDDGG